MFLRYKRIFIGVLLVSLFFVSCKKEDSSTLHRERLFSLEYGSFETSLDMFGLSKSCASFATQLTMQKGIFYISDSGGKKVLELSSFGDVLSMYYNPETVITSSSSTHTADKKESTRKVIQHSFEHPTFLAVNSKKRVYMVDFVPEDRIEYDYEENVALQDIVCWFNDADEFEYLGQERVGGTPFPPIIGLYINAHDEIIVVTRLEKKIIVFWYNSDGALMYKIPFVFELLPKPKNAHEGAFFDVDTVVPNVSEKRLFIKIDSYSEVLDSATGVTAGIVYDGSTVFELCVKTGLYEQEIAIPAYEGSSVDGAGGIDEFKKSYNLMAATANRWLFFITPETTGYALLIVHADSQKKIKKSLIVEPEELLYNAFNISHDGILSALLAKNECADIVWWRTDKLVKMYE